MKKLLWAAKMVVRKVKDGVLKFLREYSHALIGLGIVLTTVLAYSVGASDEVYKVENLLAILLLLIVWLFLYGLANVIAISPLKPPTPNKRFTKERPDGEITIEQKDVPEIILYLAELEDWLEENEMVMPEGEE